MPSGSSPVPIEALLAHQGFVRALARQLVSDPHAAEDLAQDAWVKASASPPREHASLGGWFARVVRNRASNVRRDTNRRTSRERDSARTESIESTDVAERVELESRVVRAVLALREPYRGVILGRYYEDASTAELARRQGVTESSVRSQETRALELLRRELDETFDGGRAAWSAMLVPLGAREVAANTSVPLAIGLVLAGVVVVTATTWALRDAEPDSRGVEVVSGPAGVHVPLPGAGGEPRADAGATEHMNSGVLPQDRDVDLAREAAAPPDRVPTIAYDATRAELDSFAIADLLRLVLHTQAALRARLLTPEAELVARYDSRGVGGVTRILRREFFGVFGQHDLLGLREGGSFCAFESGSHDFDEQPDLLFEEGHFRAQGWGALADLPDTSLDEVPARADVFAPAWDETTRGLWTLCWRDGVLDGRDVHPQFRADYHARTARAVQGRAEVGHTYVVRSILPGSRDALYVFQSIAADEHGHTLAWRRLHEWPIAKPERSGYRKPRALTPEQLGRPPEWLAGASAEQLFDWLARIRASSTSRLLAVPPELESAYAALFSEHRGALARVLDEGPLNALVSERWGGSHLSFLAPPKSEVRGYGNTLRLSGGLLDAGMWGDGGWGLDLGLVPLAAVTSAERVPGTIGTADQQAWQFLWEARADGSDGRLFALDTESRVREFDRPLVPRVGHSYLLRSIACSSFFEQEGLCHDLTVALHVVARDEYGFIVAWRVVRVLPPPSAR